MSPGKENGSDRPEAPPQFPPAVKDTITWLQARFGRFYKEHPPALPDRFTRREFGYILWPDKPGPPPFLRHRAYSDKGRFHWYLRKVGPHSVYYSTAYYRQPGEMSMADKQWLGAELIFDLDADHLEEAEAAKAAGREMPLQDQLKLVKGQFRYLLDEFLFGDFGIDPADVFITFSGGRGYHAHVTDPRLMGLDARGRREIVDYVTAKVPAAKGSELPDLSPFITKKAVAAPRTNSPFAKAQHAEFLAPADAPGWPGRLTRNLVATLRQNVIDAGPADARAWLVGMDGVGPKSADAFLEGFTDAKLDRIAKGHLEQGPVVKRVCHHVLQQSALALGKGETDEPVTADVKRLIRLPGSLHGKTGLQVVTLARDTLDDFDPFRDAVAFAGHDETVRFTPRFDNELTLAEQTVRVQEGEPTDVPVAHAVFWASRQQGTVQS